MKDYARSFYKSKAWKETRAAYMSSKNYICERCGDIAKICHHKVYITPENIHDPNITLGCDNLAALYQDCHTREHLIAEVYSDGLSFNCKGELIYTPRQSK